MRHIRQIIPGLIADPQAQCPQFLIAEPFTGRFNPFTGENRPGITVREIDEPAIPDFHLFREGKDIPDFGFIPQLHAPLCHRLIQFKTVKQRAAGHVPVPDALITAPILRNNRQPAVQHPGGPFKNDGQPFFLRHLNAGCHQDI